MALSVGDNQVLHEQPALCALIPPAVFALWLHLLTAGTAKTYMRERGYEFLIRSNGDML